MASFAAQPLEIVDLVSDEQPPYNSHDVRAFADVRNQPIDLVSDEETPHSSDDVQALEDAQDNQDVDMPDLPSSSPAAGAEAQPAKWDRFPVAPVYRPELGGTIVVVDGDEVFIPDEDGMPAYALLNLDYEPVLNDAQRVAEPVGQGEAASAIVANGDNAEAIPVPDEVTADSCLQRVLTIFPDISHDYVIELFNNFDQEGDYEILPGDARLENIIEQLVSNQNYPRQGKGKKALKRKREDSTAQTEFDQYETRDRYNVPNFLKGAMQHILKSEFPEIPVHFINQTLAQEIHFYQAYVALYKAKEENDGTNKRFGKGRPSTRHLADADTVAVNAGWPPLVEEIAAARSRVQALKAQKVAENEKKRVEQENLDRAIAAGETAECTVCFDDLPMNRQIHCNGAVAHFICFDCALSYIKAEVGESRCRVLCTAGCGAGFASNQLNVLSDKSLLVKLEQLMQEKDIRDAGLEDLEECPFCDYKAILPPVEEDFEFRCANPECENVSCRRCKSISHIPISCEEHAKVNKINSRHKIEEAMTAALVRKCNKCSKTFIKDYGCNKMHCPSCNNLQCYVCSKTITNYDHFDQTPQRASGAATSSKSQKCPLHDNVEERHEREVKEAEAAARTQVVEENPDLTAEDLEIKVSDAVKKSTASRIARARGDPAGGGWGEAVFGWAQAPIPLPRFNANHGRAEERGGGIGGGGAADGLQAPQRLHNVNCRRQTVRENRNRVHDHMRQLQELQQRQLMAQQEGENLQARQPAHAGNPNVHMRPRLQGYIPVLGFDQAAAGLQGPPAPPANDNNLFGLFAAGPNPPPAHVPDVFPLADWHAVLPPFPVPNEPPIFPAFGPVGAPQPLNPIPQPQGHYAQHQPFNANGRVANPIPAPPPDNGYRYVPAANLPRPVVRDPQRNFDNLEMLRVDHNRRIVERVRGGETREERDAREIAELDFLQQQLNKSAERMKATFGRKQ